MHLWPTINVSEQSRANIDKIHAEQPSIAHMTIHDIVYDMQQSNVVVPNYMLDMLTSSDEYASYMFYGVKYSQTSPIIIYPKVRPTFVNCARMSTSVESELISRMARRDGASVSSHMAESGSSISMSAYVQVQEAAAPIAPPHSSPDSAQSFCQDTAAADPVTPEPPIASGVAAAKAHMAAVTPDIGSGAGQKLDMNAFDSSESGSLLTKQDTSLVLLAATQEKEGATKDVFSFSLQTNKATRTLEVLCNTCTFNIKESVRTDYSLTKKSNFLLRDAGSPCWSM